MADASNAICNLLLTAYYTEYLLLASYCPLPRASWHLKEGYDASLLSYCVYYLLLATTYLAHLCHLEGRRDDGIEAHIAALVCPNLQKVACAE